jgi:Arc/MetJ-type ribon-helix-helix transcriptional regulator
MKTISLKIPPEMDRELMRAARRAKATKSELVREAIDALLSTSRRFPTRFYLERARRFAGIVEGPGDLMTNPKRFEGFGR